jgi:Transglutaminase-like superfamily
MMWHVIESYLLLLRFGVVMRFRTFKALSDGVRKQRVNAHPAPQQISAERLCHAVDLACVFYFKQVLCLQRSAATTVLLRRYGVGAEMVIGAQMIPHAFHAWVEINHLVVNDRPYMLDIYQVLERC